MVKIPTATVLVLAALALQRPAPVAAAELSSPSPRPKVCLVLSGGGARGAAHVGVLKVLEELRVPVDCIAGTSMGALVGGGYASGLSVADMEALLGKITTQLLFREQPPRQDRAIRRKLDDRSLLFGFELGVRDGSLQLQKGAVSGVQLETVLRQIAGAHGYRKFDELPIPFRAVATDLVSGKPVVFTQGELPNVMRASMSVPVAIAPVEIDGRILVDGGLTNNLPVNVARAMGADVVIAVNLGTPLLKREGLSTVLGVSEQMINILTEQNVQASLDSLRPTDILIQPALGDFSASDFDHLIQTVPIGEAAARAAQARLAPLALPPEQYAALRKRQGVLSPQDLRAVDEVRFAPMARVSAESLKRFMDTQPGQPIKQETLDADLRRLYGQGDFEHLNYRIVEEAGRRVLDIDAVEKAWGPNYLRFGLSLGSDFRGDAFYNAAVSYRRTWVNALGAEWRTDVQAGRTGRIFTEFYQPLHVLRYFFVAPYVELERRPVDLFSGGQRVARYDVHSTQAGIDVGSDLTKYGELRVGLVATKVKATLDTGPEELAPLPGRVRANAFTARAVFDQLDNANFPGAGWAGAAQVYGARKALGANDVEDFTRWEGSFHGAHSFGSHIFQAALHGGGPVGGGTLPRYAYFTWGGLLQQSGYPTGSLVGDRLAFGRLVYQHRFHRQFLLDGVYAGVSLEAGRMSNPPAAGNPTGTLKSAAVFFGLDSPLGPFYVGYGRAADGSSSAYLFLGRP